MADMYAGLHYGVTVNIYDLVRASKVFERFRSQSLVLDILILRLGNGSLDETEATGISRCPIEILLQIKRDLFDIIFEAEPHPWVAVHLEHYKQRISYFEGRALEQLVERTQEFIDSINVAVTTDPEIAESNLHPAEECGACEALWDNPLMSRDSCKPLLESFGLELPSSFPNYLTFPNHPNGGESWPFEGCAILIALPSYVAMSGLGSSHAIAHSDMEQGRLSGIEWPKPTQGTVYYDANSFVLPPDAQERFERLMRQYRIRTCYSPGPLVGLDRNKARDGFVPMKEEMQAEEKITPRWTLLYGGFVE